ncbi:MAG: hypothetical protein Q4D96_14115 [Propionibacteriaceae bacterium]|nr:hypothetical protein [Propionibacteriaceae bacterium]
MNPNSRKAIKVLDFVTAQHGSPEGITPEAALANTSAAQALALIAIADELHLANLLTLRGHTVNDADRDATELEHAMDRCGLTWVEYTEKETQQ